MQVFRAQLILHKGLHGVFKKSLQFERQTGYFKQRKFSGCSLSYCLVVVRWRLPAAVPRREVVVIEHGRPLGVR